MAGSVNDVTLLGLLGADPEIRATKDGRSIANMRLATSKSWRDKSSGDRKESTEWHAIVVFNEHLVEKVIKPYVKKGSKILIRGGEIQTRKWQDQSGNDRYTTEIVLQFDGKITLLDSKRDNNSSDNDRAEPREDDRGSSKPAENKGGGGGSKYDFDDTIPF